jgi:hypothetical protein
MGECNPVATSLDTSVKLTSIMAKQAPADPQEYVQIVGGLTFAACVTRPDMACAVGQLSQFLNKPSSMHMHTAKQVLCYLQDNPHLESRTVLRLSDYKAIRMQTGPETWTHKGPRQDTSSCSTIEQLNGRAVDNLLLHCLQWNQNIWLLWTQRKN